ncbi:chloride channel protein [Flavobacterium psychrotrophum]|uniref:chloride channel protein n=1 Tax=Flavobacterium psychrotrophum TaxID=2294119 RepID=UPI000E32119E|nr:chloride channel protein [Flavobacterium psychrotrophum]
MFSKIQPVRLKQLFILSAGSIVVGSLAAILGLALKHLTEHYEDILLNRAEDNKLWLILFPITALSLIYILRFYLFKNKENKGLKEVFNSTKTNDQLPAYKIPSHFINGFLTVIFGGSTGIEVSTVVATAAAGSLASKKEPLLKKYKSELICAGVAAGITALFNAPLAGMLFAYEVIIKKHRKTFAISTFIGAAVSYGFTYVLNEAPLLNLDIKHWHLYALPWFVLLGILAGFQSVYLTRSVIFFKKQFLKFTNPYFKIITGAIIISTCLILLPQLYGEGYHAIKEYIATANTSVFSLYFLITIVGLLLLKPVITAITLSAGGDGGVFAPGLFLGAFLGLFTAVLLNTFFDAGVIPLNFMIVGMAAVLSAGIHAPFTALFLICGLTNDYTLVIPLLIAVLVAKYTAARLYPYTVYTYAG